MKQPRRVRIRTANHYAVFRMDDEVTLAELMACTRSPVPPPRTHLLALAMQSAQRAQARAAAERARAATHNARADIELELAEERVA